MPKGNKLAYLNSPFSDNNTPVDYDENKNIIEHCLEMFNASVPDLSKPDEVKQCIDNYFQSCINRGLRPGNMGLYNALGIERRDILRLLNGQIKLNASPLSIAYIKRACKTISEIRELLGSQGKLNPATLIFWQKNYDGLSDVQQIDLNPVNIQPNKTPEEIAAEIDEIPTD